MNLPLRHLRIPDSPLSRWDARWKLSGLVVAIVGICTLAHVIPICLGALASLTTLACARLPSRSILTRLGILLLASLPFLIILPLTMDPTGVGWAVGVLHISERGIVAGLAVLGRCVGIGCLVIVLGGTSALPHSLAAAQQLSFPPLLLNLTRIAYTHAFLLSDQLLRMRVAARVRGFRPRATAHGYRTLGHLTGAVLVRGAERGEQVAAAMRCRGFDGRFHTLDSFRTSAADVVGFLLCLGVSAVLVLWDRLGEL